MFAACSLQVCSLTPANFATHLRAAGAEEAARLVELQARDTPFMPNLRVKRVRAVGPLRVPHLDAAIEAA